MATPKYFFFPLVVLWVMVGARHELCHGTAYLAPWFILYKAEQALAWMWKCSTEEQEGVWVREYRVW